MLSQGMLFCLLFTLSISICLFMYIHQKTSSIEKNIKNVVQFIQGIERDVQGMNNQQTNRKTMTTDKIVVSDNEEEVHDIPYNNTYNGTTINENSATDIDNDYYNDNTDDSDEDNDSEEEEIYGDEMKSKSVDMFKNIVDSQTHIQFNEGVVDINTSPLHEMFNIQVLKTFENIQSKPTLIDNTQLNNMTVSDLRKELRNHDSSITSYNAKKMKKKELIDRINSFYHSKNEHDTDQSNIIVESNENTIENVTSNNDLSND